MYNLVSTQAPSFLHLHGNEDSHIETSLKFRPDMPWIAVLKAEVPENDGLQLIYEPRREKTGFLHMRKQSRRSVVR